MQTVSADPLSATEGGEYKHAIKEIRDVLKTVGHLDEQKNIDWLESNT